MTFDLSAATLAALWQAAPSGGPGLTPLLIQFGLIFLIFYFLIIRPQQRQRKRHEEALRNLKRGDRVVTSGGIVAEVVHLKETLKDGAPQKSMEDEVTIKSAESRLIVERGRIAKIVLPTGETSTATKQQAKATDASDS
jgi:preprotein translocase subunit YajC